MDGSNLAGFGTMLRDTQEERQLDSAGGFDPVSGTRGPTSLWDEPPEGVVEPIFNDIVVLAKLLSGAEAAAFSVLDHERVWLRARVGVSICSLPQAAAISTYAVQRDGMLEIADTHAVPALVDHPLVRGAYEGMPALRSYAAVPLYSAPPERVFVGTLSVFSTRPHTLSDEACAGLVDLASHLQGHLHARDATRRDPVTGLYHAPVMVGLVARAVQRMRHGGGSLSLVGLVPAQPITRPAAQVQYAGRVADALLGHGELAGHAMHGAGTVATPGRLLLLLPSSAPVHAAVIAGELRESLAVSGLIDDSGRPAHFGLGIAGRVWSAGLCTDAEAEALAAALIGEVLRLARDDLDQPG